jgi:hypothetical protein
VCVCVCVCVEGCGEVACKQLQKQPASLTPPPHVFVVQVAPALCALVQQTSSREARVWTPSAASSSAASCSAPTFSPEPFSESCADEPGARNSGVTCVVVA